MLKTFITAVAAAVLLAGCQSTATQPASAPGQTFGGAINSQYGTAGNAKIAQGGTGTMLGAFIGKEAKITPADLPVVEAAAKRAYAAPVGERISWNNPQTGSHGTITSTREGYNSAGTYCREYQQTVTAANQTELIYGTACKQADGKWKIVTNN